jgi:hypothetical protein
MKPDIIINVRFFTPSEGGRTTSVGGRFYACPLFIDGEGFDCRLLLDGKSIKLGEACDIPVKFLYQDLALKKSAIGKEIFLWEGKIIAKGSIIKFCD